MTNDANDQLIRTPFSGVYLPKLTAWGAYYQQIPDPLATVDKVPVEFQLRPDIPKIPYSLWSAIIDLYFHYARISSLEVSVLLLRDAATKQQWKVVVPKQTVTGASVHAEDFANCIDLITGEVYDQFPPAGWLHAGSSHSHHVMSCSFSAVDDANELDVPGAHILVRSISLAKMEYVPDASIVQQRKRYKIAAADLIELAGAEGEEPTKPHESVFSFISQHSYYTDYADGVYSEHYKRRWQTFNSKSYGKRNSYGFDLSKLLPGRKEQDTPARTPLGQHYSKLQEALIEFETFIEQLMTTYGDDLTFDHLAEALVSIEYAGYEKQYTNTQKPALEIKALPASKLDYDETLDPFYYTQGS